MVGEVDVAARGIGDHEQALVRAVDDQIGERPALRAGEHGVTKLGSRSARRHRPAPGVLECLSRTRPPISRHM